MNISLSLLDILPTAIISYFIILFLIELFILNIEYGLIGTVLIMASIVLNRTLLHFKININSIGLLIGVGLVLLTLFIMYIISLVKENENNETKLKEIIYLVEEYKLLTNRLCLKNEIKCPLCKNTSFMKISSASNRLVCHKCGRSFSIEEYLDSGE